MTIIPAFAIRRFAFIVAVVEKIAMVAIALVLRKQSKAEIMFYFKRPLSGGFLSGFPGGIFFGCNSGENRNLIRLFE